MLPYAELKAANVDGTREALALAALHRPSAFHHVSTIEVFAEAGDGPLAEDHPAGPPQALRGGYAQTKWVAEQLVTEAAGRGLPAVIYRLPRILGDSRTGACQSRDLLWQILKGCIQAQAIPAVAAEYHLAPADWTASTLVSLSRTASRPGAAYHVTAAEQTSFRALTGYLRAAGYQLREYPLEEWAAIIAAQPGNAALPVLDIFRAEMTGSGWSQVRLGTARTAEALGSAALPCAAVTPELFATYLSFFTSTGYL